MKKIFRPSLLAFSLLLLSFAAFGQQTPQAGFSANAAAERLPNLDVVKEQLRQYHACTSGCYTSDMQAQANLALDFLHQRVTHRAPGEKLAMVLDIDETTLSNWDEMLKAGFAYEPKAFTAWEESAQATAFPGTLQLYKEAQRLGVSVFFITGRPEAERAATERNLKAQGFADWQHLTLRAPEESATSTTVYKSAARRRIVQQGYTLILNLGDQWSDLKGAPEAEFSVKYPNPFYLIP
jgi:acid phosphatase